MIVSVTLILSSAKISRFFEPISNHCNTAAVVTGLFLEHSTKANKTVPRHCVLRVN